MRAIAKDHDPVDLVMHENSGSTNGIESVLMNDKTLSNTVFLNRGHVVNVPERQSQQTKQVVNLWD